MAKKDIAVLITCHNRREKTLKCLSALFECTMPEDYQLDVYLVDDGSTDGTGEAIRNKFPEVYVINGSGHLYWNQGMRLAWDIAAKNKGYDFYLWLNDDAFLDQDAIQELLSCYKIALEENKLSIIAGSCRNSSENTEFSYGGRNENGPVIPNGELQACTYINGNVVLVPQIIYRELGNLSPDYAHGIGDYDYGLRALNAGFNLFLTRNFIATCEKNNLPAWSDPNTPLFKRLKLLHSPKGLNLNDYIEFRKKFWGWRWILDMVKAYAKVIFPRMYNYFKNNT